MTFANFFVYMKMFFSRLMCKFLCPVTGLYLLLVSNALNATYLVSSLEGQHMHVRM